MGTTVQKRRKNNQEMRRYGWLFTTTRYTNHFSDCEISQWQFTSTPPFPPDSCYLSGAPCQTIIRRLSDAGQMSHQTSVNSHQTSVRQVPHIHQTCTICPPDKYCAICTPDVHQTYTRHPPPICQMYGICLMYMWYLSHSGSWQMSGETSDRHLAIVWQSSDREHQTNRNCLAETVVYMHCKFNTFYSQGHTCPRNLLIRHVRNTGTPYLVGHDCTCISSLHPLEVTLYY